MNMLMLSTMPVTPRPLCNSTQILSPRAMPPSRTNSVRSANAEVTVEIHAVGDDGDAAALGHRCNFAGEKRFICLGFARFNHTIGGKSLAGFDKE